MQTMTLEPKDYQKRSRDARKARGGKLVSIVLEPAEAQALEAIKLKHGLNARDAIGKALLELAKRTK